MDLQVWERYRDATDPKVKRELLGKLVQDNARLVHKFVDRFQRNTRAGCDPDDAYQVGMIGLMYAIQKFDPARGSLATIAQHWIRHEFQKGSLLDQTIQRPRSSGMPGAVAKRIEHIRTTQGREAELEDLQDLTQTDGTPLKVTRELFDRWTSVQLVTSLDQGPESSAGRTSHVGGVRRHMSTDVAGVPLRELIPGDDGDRPDVRFDGAAFDAETLPWILGKLDPTARTIVSGLLEERNAQEVGRLLGLTSIRYREAKAAALARCEALLEEHAEEVPRDKEDARIAVNAYNRAQRARRRAERIAAGMPVPRRGRPPKAKPEVRA